MLFSCHFEVQKWKFEQSENLKIQDACDVIYLTIVAMETN